MRITPIALGVLMLTAVFVSFVPTASAQDQQASLQIFDLKAPDGDLQPLIDVKEVTGKVKLTYVGNGCATLGNLEVTLSVAKQPSWAQVALQPSTLLFTPKQGQECAGNVEDTQPFKAFVFATAEAPAFQSEPLQIKADLKKMTGLTTASAPGDVFIKAGFFSILEARVESPIVIARPQENVQIPLTLRNFGNAPTKINFEIESNQPDRLVPSAIPAVTVDTKVRGAADTATVQLSAITPYHNGYLNEVGSIKVKYQGAYAQDVTKLGDKGELNVIVTTRGFYVPATNPLLGVLGLLGIVGIVALGRKLRSN